MSLVKLLKPKWYFYIITGTHIKPRDDPAGEQVRRDLPRASFYVTRSRAVAVFYLIYLPLFYWTYVFSLYP